MKIDKEKIVGLVEESINHIIMEKLMVKLNENYDEKFVNAVYEIGNQMKSLDKNELKEAKNLLKYVLQLDNEI